MQPDVVRRGAAVPRYVGKSARSLDLEGALLEQMCGFAAIEAGGGSRL